MLTDVAALALSLFVARFSRQSASPQRTCRVSPMEVLAAFLNGATLLSYLCLDRVGSGRATAGPRAPRQHFDAHGCRRRVVSSTSSLLACCTPTARRASTCAPHISTSLATSSARRHRSGRARRANNRLARGGPRRVDRHGRALILRGAWRLVRESVDVLLESTPSHISLGSVRAQLEAIPGVESVHDLHVWTVIILVAMTGTPSFANPTDTSTSSSTCTTPSACSASSM